MSKKNRIRLFTEEKLITGTKIACTVNQAHYLQNVMRVKLNDEVYIFNGKDGEFCAKLIETGKKSCVLLVTEKFKNFEPCPDIWLLFAPLKKENNDFTIQKAVELGVTKIIPVITEYTSNSKIRTERLNLQMIEAAEQCRRVDLPQAEEPIKLSDLLNNWDKGRKLLYMDETGAGNTAGELLPQCSAPAAILIGPEGGFSEKELETLRKLPYTYGISLGKRILRAETAAISALALWQTFCGDWQKL